jgi:hypothetical protein
VGIGYSLRALKFAKYYFKDKSLLDVLDNRDVHVCRTYSRGSRNLLNNIKLARLPNEGSRKLFRNIPHIYKFPDAQKSWIKKAVRLG